MRKFLLLIMVLVMMTAWVYADDGSRDLSIEEKYANELKELNLFHGVSETDMALEKKPSRVEAIVMLIRVLGAEDEALSGKYSHNFTDVPKWADSYIGYAYQEGLTKGISDTKFGTGVANANMYVTFMLRALGYTDTNNLDFKWDNPFELAYNIKIIPGNVDLNDFLRADAATISHASLEALIKNSDKRLADKLISQGVFSETKFKEVFSKTGQEMFKVELLNYDTNAYGTYKITLFQPLKKGYDYWLMYGYSGGAAFEQLSPEILNDNIYYFSPKASGYIPNNPRFWLAKRDLSLNSSSIYNRQYGDWDSYSILPGEKGFIDETYSDFVAMESETIQGLQPMEVHVSNNKIEFEQIGDYSFLATFPDIFLKEKEVMDIEFHFYGLTFNFGYECVYKNIYYEFENGNLVMDFNKVSAFIGQEKLEQEMESLRAGARFTCEVRLINNAIIKYQGSFDGFK